MLALNILLPVFFMMALGYVSRIKGWISSEQKAGANSLVFTVLFPILIFSLLMTADFQFSTLSIVLYVLVAFCLAILAGKVTTKFTGEDKSHFTPYLITTVEGGSVALPLYLSIVGSSSTTIIFDLAGVAMAFFILPVLIARQTASSTSFSGTVKAIFSNPFVLATLLGLLANFIGLYDIFAYLGLLEMYTGIIDRATGPIVGIILFVLGYDLHFQKETFASVLRLGLVRMAFYALVIAGFFLLFPGFMAEPMNRIGVLLYFMCPTGFALPSVMAPAFKDDKDEQFASTFISLYMVVTLIVYAVLVITM